MKKILYTSTAILLFAFSAQAQTAPNDNGSMSELRDMQLQLIGALVGSAQPAQTTETDNRTVSYPSTTGNAQGAVSLGSLTVKSTDNGRVQLSGDAQRDAQGVNIENSSNSQVANGVNLSARGFAPQAGGGLIPLAVQTNANSSQQNAIGQYAGGGATLGEYGTYNTTKTTSTTASSSTSSKSGVTATAFNVNNNKVSTATGAAGGQGFGANLSGGGVDVDDTFTTKAGALFGLISGEVTVTSGYEKDYPNINAHSNGPGCAVADGTCSAEGSASNSSSHTEKLESAPTKTIKNVSADYISLGNSDLTIGTNAVVDLSGNAQAGAKGVNLVNASNSQVANGVNISAGSGLGVASGVNTNLVQSNVVIQR